MMGSDQEFALSMAAGRGAHGQEGTAWSRGVVVPWKTYYIPESAPLCSQLRNLIIIILTQL
jgi:hypothetical protein